MEKYNENIDLLFQKYLRNQCTSKEILFLFQYFDIDENEIKLKELIRGELDRELKNLNIGPEKIHLDNIYQKISNEINKDEIKPLYRKKNFLPLIRIAASLILVSFAVATSYMYLTNQSVKELPSSLTTIAEPQPGGSKAVLTLHNGSQIVLNDIKDGEVINEQGMIVSKTSEGRVVYQVDPSISINPEFEASLNTIVTPRGGEYEIVLADGTRVWLNSASTLTFPTGFSGKERKVELIGEAYFEVAHDKSKPFFVKTSQNEVEVLGTHFNIMAYPEEGVNQTTLLEGSVKVRHGKNEKLLKPGQQAEIKKGSLAIGMRTVDLEKVIAWKNGVFLFDQSDLSQVMQQIARWYDAEVVYEDKKPSVVLTGMVSRKNSLKGLLEILENAGGVDFDIKGNKIIVHNLKLSNMKK